MLEGRISTNEFRILLGYETIDSEIANEILVDSGKTPLSDLGIEIDLQ